jgi:hypothetical protein
VAEGLHLDVGDGDVADAGGLPPVAQKVGPRLGRFDQGVGTTGLQFAFCDASNVKANRAAAVDPG